jgi:hypothetical protein
MENGRNGLVSQYLGGKKGCFPELSKHHLESKDGFICGSLWVKQAC